MHVRVFYLILPDQMFQEPFPVHKDSIKLMKTKSCICELRPTRRGPGVLVAAALFLENKQPPESQVWTCQQHPREPATPTPAQGPGKCIVNVTELNWGDLVSPFPEANSKEMQKR